ncbi:MAG TPA: hypothetical protein PLI51_04690 [bacterium]|nr:hypothetical protein [bacterium]HPQ66008.1 hypothetical protein [bacterium]
MNRRGRNPRRAPSLARAALSGRVYRIRELIRARRAFSRRLRILFSEKKDWEKPLRAGFRFTGHEVFFGELSRAAVSNCDLVVPLTIADLAVLNSMRDAVAANPLPIPAQDAVRLCEDKSRLNRFLAAAGFAGSVPALEAVSSFPYILKKNVDGWGENTHVVRNAGDEERFSDLLARTDYFRQELVPGNREYATHIVFRNGSVVCALDVEYGFETPLPVKGKDRPVYTRVRRCPHLALFGEVLAAIGFQGLCCFNYKERAGRPMLLEINPRFGASLAPFFFSFVPRLFERRRRGPGGMV